MAYYPVRKSASSSLQHAFGGEPVDMRLVPTGILSFSLVRNPFDRLASLYANNLDYYPFTAHGIYKGMDLQDFVDAVCETREPQCDHHFWEAARNIPAKAEVFYFEDIDREIKRLNKMYSLNIKLRHFGLTKANKPRFNEGQLDQLTWRYRHDLKRFYENNTTPEDCRSRGQAKARLRQRDTDGTVYLNLVGDRTLTTHRSKKR
jgi:hypothetical protein